MSLLYKQFTIFGQAYGTDTYGEQTYSCTDTQTTCQTTEGAPNTGFFGNSDAALATTAGALLIAVALVGVVFVVLSRIKSRKKNSEQK